MRSSRRHLRSTSTGRGRAARDSRSTLRSASQTTLNDQWLLLIAVRPSSFWALSLACCPSILLFHVIPLGSQAPLLVSQLSLDCKMCAESRGHYITNPNNALLSGKSLEIAMDLYCSIPPNVAIYGNPWKKNGSSYLSTKMSLFADLFSIESNL